MKKFTTLSRNIEKKLKTFWNIFTRFQKDIKKIKKSIITPTKLHSYLIPKIICNLKIKLIIIVFKEFNKSQKHLENLFSKNLWNKQKYLKTFSKDNRITFFQVKIGFNINKMQRSSLFCQIFCKHRMLSRKMKTSKITLLKVKSRSV